MAAPRIIPTGVLVGRTGDKGDRGEVGPSGGPFPDLTGVTPGKVPQTTGDGGVEFIDLSASSALGVTGAFTYNADGTVATDPLGGVYAYNADGTVHTYTLGSVTRTYSYNADGTVASIA